MERIGAIFLVSLFISACLVGGCATPSDELSRGLQDEDPSIRISAVIEAGRTKARDTVPYLIDRLTDSESDVRFFAIISLEKITGQTMDYNYYDSPPEQAEAVGRWRGWLKQQQNKQSSSSRSDSP